MSDKPKPVHTIRVGSVQGAIWSNPGQHGTFYNVTIERRFRDAEEQWQSSGSFGRDDLLIVAKVADAAHTYICERQAEERASSAGQKEQAAANPSTQAETGKRRSR